MKKKIVFTKGETLFLWRNSCGINQMQAAEKFKVSRSKYARWEHDELEDIPTLPNHLHLIRNAQNTCLILRRRSGKTQAHVAKQLGFCRYWVNKMENGYAPIEPLLEFWGL